MHGVRIAMPTIEIADDRCPRALGPNSKLDAIDAIMRTSVLPNEDTSLRRGQLVQTTRVRSRRLVRSPSFMMTKSARSRVAFDRLCGHARTNLPFVDVIAMLHATNTLVERRHNDDGFLHHTIVSGFKQKRNDVHDQLSGLRILLAGTRKGAHDRMDERV